MNSMDKAACFGISSTPDDEVLSPRIQAQNDELARLAELLCSQDLTLHSQSTTISTQRTTIRSQDLKIQALIQEVAYLRRMRYGVKS